MLNRGIYFAQCHAQSGKVEPQGIRRFVQNINIYFIERTEPRSLNLVCEENGPEASPNGSVTGIAGYREPDAFAYLST